MAADGADYRQLLDTRGRDCTPRWHPHPSRREIVFMTVVSSGDDSTFSILTYDLDATAGETIYAVNSKIGHPSFTHDGSRIVFVVHGEGGGLWTVAAKGGEPEEINNSDGWGKVLSAECSPSEPLVAYYQIKDGAINVYTIALEGGEPTRLTQFNYGGSESLMDYYYYRDRLYNLSWFKDGSHLVVTHFPDPETDPWGSWWNSDNVMFFLPKDGGSPFYIGAYIYSPSMSPDG